MEDVSIGLSLRHLGKLDHFIIVRVCVNMDVFVLNTTPESLWGETDDSKYFSDEEDAEAADIFVTALENEFKVVEVIIKAIGEGKLN